MNARIQKWSNSVAPAAHIVFACAVMLSVGTVSAAEIRGNVLDSRDRVALPGVEISVQGIQSGERRTVVSGVAGDFEMTSVPMGDYLFSTRLDGLTPIECILAVREDIVRFDPIMSIVIIDYCSGGCGSVECMCASAPLPATPPRVPHRRPARRRPS